MRMYQKCIANLSQIENKNLYEQLMRMRWFQIYLHCIVDSNGMRLTELIILFKMENSIC